MTNPIKYLILTPDRMAINGWGYECEVSRLRDHCQKQFNQWLKLFNQEEYYINAERELIDLEDLINHCFYVELVDTPKCISLHENDIQLITSLSTILNPDINRVVWIKYGVIALSNEKGKVDFDHSVFDSPSQGNLHQFLNDEKELERVISQYIITQPFKD